MKGVDKRIIGIDEAGRGPLAGPVSVGAFCFLGIRKEEKTLFLKDIFDRKGIRDSKKMSEKKRDEIYAKLLKYRKNKKVSFFVSMQSAQTINKIGISAAIKKALKNCLSKCTENSFDVEVLLDGSLYAPTEYKYQKTIIKGDEKIIEIALASVCAKVRRDRLMIAMDKKYPKYGFAIHKGYGTRMHREVIEKFGITKEHRTLFCRKLTK